MCGDNWFYEHSHEYDSVSFFYDVGIVDMNNTTYISGVDCHLKYLHLQICVFVHFIWCNRTIVLEFNVRMNAVTGPAAS